MTEQLKSMLAELERLCVMYRGYEYAYTKADSEYNGEFVRVYRVYTDKAPSNI